MAEKPGIWESWRELVVVALVALLPWVVIGVATWLLVRIFT